MPDLIKLFKDHWRMTNPEPKIVVSIAGGVENLRLPASLQRRLLGELIKVLLEYA